MSVPPEELPLNPRAPASQPLPSLRAPARSSASQPPPPSRRVPLRDLPRCPTDGLALVSAEVLADADGDPFLGATIADRYVILGKLGAGSMGTVYRARQELMGRDVALKILRSDRAFDAQAKARFTREARAMSLLSSPHTVTVFDFGEIADDSPDADLGLGTGGSLYLAMELLEGESLGHRLKRARRLPVADAVRFARHALMSLAEAHDKGIIHRDLKPDNLYLAEPPSGEHDEICKVLDFGIAKVMSDGGKSVDALETQAGTVFGTPRYMSPEQAQGRPLDARSDLYSLGVLLYQMLVGRPPFVDDDAVVVMARHIKSTPLPAIEAAPDAGIPRALSELLQRVLAKSPDDRPSSATAFIEEIERATAAGERDARERDRAVEAGSAEVGATGELLAVVGDDLETSQARAVRGVSPRSRFALVVVALAAIALIGIALAASSLRARGDVREAKKHIAIAAASVGPRLTAARAAPAPSAPAARDAPSIPTPPSEPSAAPSAASTPSAPAAPAPRQPRPRPRNYTKFN